MNVRLIAIAAALVLVATLGFAAAGCGADEGAISAGDVPSVASETDEPIGSETAPSETAPSGTSPATTETSEGAPPDATTGEEDTVSYQIWFTRDQRLVPVRRSRPFTQRVGTAALEDLLAGPTEAERAAGFTSAIPDGVQLLALAIDDAIATVDLSAEFESGGGSHSIFARLGQVTCTLTQFPTVKGVLFELDGRPVDVFSSEGVILDEAAKCEDYEDVLPPIVVDTPRPGQVVTSPVTVSGTANVFEANVTIRILDARGRELVHTFVTATCGTGCRGDYSLDVPFKVDRRTEGTIVVHDDAADVGPPPHIVRVPVVLSP